LRRLIDNVLKQYLPFIKDALPFDIRQRHGLLNSAKSLLEIHFPENLDLQKEAYRRLAFEEFFLFIIPVALRKFKASQRPGIRHKTERELAKKFEDSLPFQLTNAQKRVIEEIKQDMARASAMQRLIQGDVGCGKTIVATYAAIFALQSGYQAAFMAPTEILAKQHYEKINSQLSALGRQWPVVSGQKKDIRVALLVSSLDKKEKEKIYQEIKNGKVDLAIGTHALLQEVVQFKNLGLVIIDEQHKFGVAQRAFLPQKGNNPDVLIMTATPIPRTLAITLYGDLDISIIDELPPGRKPIVTRWVRQAKRREVYQFIREKVKEGRQVYIVYPIIKESHLLDLYAAEQMYKELKKDVFGDLRLGLVHGQMRQELQDKTMAEFKEGKVDILVSTTVLEVGIDVANATVMVIEHAERFGLSQLHQLRGRIGRGGEESFCILVSDAPTEEARARLEIMSRTNDGFRIAEEDLRLRGPGEFFGERQHGLSELRLANPLTQMRLLRQAKNEAIKLIQADPRLESRQNQGIKEVLKKKFPRYEESQVVG
ncbi:MAG: ATP-dependent DNA helicase RecG, partial [Candidatus Omnitrophica bacterium]|nr:ATP-dependent DNA helicase RecG [Candidatus Omnitrophota bacterium]